MKLTGLDSSWTGILKNASDPGFDEVHDALASRRTLAAHESIAAPTSAVPPPVTRYVAARDASAIRGGAAMTTVDLVQPGPLIGASRGSAVTNG